MCFYFGFVTLEMVNQGGSVALWNTLVNVQYALMYTVHFSKCVRPSIHTHTHTYVYIYWKLFAYCAQYTPSALLAYECSLQKSICVCMYCSLEGAEVFCHIKLYICYKRFIKGCPHFETQGRPLRLSAKPGTSNMKMLADISLIN